MVTFPEVGDWVRWVNVDIQRDGQVILSQYPSMIVRWLGVDDPQVFPWAHTHFMIAGDMEIIAEPPRASLIAAQRASGVLGIDAAAASLGITPKRVRQLLREGKLEGHQESGRWVEVVL